MTAVVFEGLDNFRDFGGYAGADGRSLRRGRLFRSAGHGRATEADFETLSRLGITLVVDLRRPDERARDPSPSHPTFTGEVLHTRLPEREGEDGWRTLLQESDLSEAAFRAYLLDYYRAAPFNPRHLDLFSRYFEALAETSGGVLIHCVAGKDRTGLLAALTHHVAGVSADDTMTDYLATNDPVRLAARLPLASKAIAEVAGRSPSPAAVEVAMGVDAVYLQTALAAIAERHGDADAYLEQELGVDPARRRAIEARLLE